MKTSRIFTILILLFLIIVFSLSTISINAKKKNAYLIKYNGEYEEYLSKTVSGTELATLINKTINQNEINKVEKDKEKHYIENDKDSIRIEIKLTVTNKTYPMEEFYNNDTSEFIRFFAQEQFTCTNIEYHKKTGMISKLNFEQL